VHTRSPLFLASLLSLALAAGCTVPSKGDPLPAGSPDTTAPRTSGTAEALPYAGAPKVDDPLDTSTYEKDPCKSLTADQAEYLSLPRTGKPTENEVLGIGCDWFNEETRGEVQIVFLVGDPRGLSPEYDADKKGRWEYFEELPDIDGYPAVIRLGTDDRDAGHCTVVVGVADDMAFETILRLSEVNVGTLKPCEVAADVAGMAVKTMKEEA
jgi:uncharacterized protein DUF3558